VARFSGGGAAVVTGGSGRLDRPEPALRLTAAWLVHLYTASGAVLGFLAACDVFQYRYREAFFWLALAVFVDATDGVLARLARVSERIPWFSGPSLDNIVDYLTYVFVPALFVWRALLVPSDWTTVVCGAMLLSSAYGFNRTDAKTSDHFFTGFPSYWNVVVLYLLLGGATPQFNGIVLLILAVLVFVPVRYVYPSRTPVLRGLTIALGAIWGLLVFLMIWQMPGVSRLIYWLSLLFPVYYAGLSLALTRGRAIDAVR
jgi:phosphatidylcholine synthase